MAQDILITPGSGEPQILFRGSGALDTSITLNVLSSHASATGSGTALSFEGTQGQLFTITDNLSSGNIFSVNDITGLSLISADASGDVRIGQYGRYVGIGSGVPSYGLDVSSSGQFQKGFILSSYVPAVTANALYNDGGTLKFGGSAVGGGGMTNFILEDGDGTEVTVSDGKEVKFIEGAGIDIDWTDVSDGSDGDPYDLTFTVDHDAASNFVANEHIDHTSVTLTAGDGLSGGGTIAANRTFAVEAAQTTITSLLATDIKIGEDNETKIDFETADTINFYAANEKQLILTDGALTPGTNAIVDLGTDALEFKDGYFDGTLEADAITIGGTNIVTGSLITTLGTISAGTWQGTAIATAYIADDAITGAKIALFDDSLAATSTHFLIADGTDYSSFVLSGDVTCTNAGVVSLAANSVDSDQYVDGSIDNAHIADDAIDSEHYADGSIDNAHIADDAIDSEHYAAGSIDTAHIADNQVTLAKMAGITRGSIIIGDASGDPAALGIGSNTYVLTSDGTDIAWAAAGGGAGDITAVVAGAGLTGGATSGSATVDVVGGDGITANANDVAITAAQTTVTSVYNASLKMGRDSQNLIDFATTDNKIILRVNNVDEVELVENALSPITTDGVSLGTSSLNWSDLFLDSGAVINFDSGDVTLTHSSNTLTVAGGNLAATLSTAAQTNITTVGTLTTLTVDSIIINGTTIGHTSDTDAITIAAEGDVTFSKAIKPAAPAAASGTSGIVVLDCNTTNHFTITTSGNITGWNFTNASPGQRIIVRVTNGASHTIAFSATGDGDVVHFPGGTEPVLTTSGGIDVYGFLCIAADTLDGFIIGQDIKA